MLSVKLANAESTLLASSQLTTSIHKNCHCTVHVFVGNFIGDSMWFFLVEANLCSFLSSFVYICIDVGDTVIKKIRVGRYRVGRYTR